MSRIITFLFVFIILQKNFSCNFPCFLNLNDSLLDIETIQLHTKLIKKVSIPPLGKKNNLKNLFSCCFIFNFGDGSSQKIFLPDIFTSCQPTCFSGKFVGLALVSSLLEECKKIKEFDIFNVLQKLYTNTITFDEQSSDTLIQALISTYKSRYETLPSIIKSDEKIAISMRATDSETQSIYMLNDKKYLQFHLIAKLPNKEIASIEFHGCSTFDMCPFCFTHMNMVQCLSNNNAKAGFLCLLKNLLIEKKLLTNPNIPTTIIISSYKNGNYLHNQTYGWMETAIKENCVNQFRMSDYKIDNFIVQDVPLGTNDISFALAKADPTLNINPGNIRNEIAKNLPESNFLEKTTKDWFQDLKKALGPSDLIHFSTPLNASIKLVDFSKNTIQSCGNFSHILTLGYLNKHFFALTPILPGYHLVNVSGENNNCGIRALLTFVSGTDNASVEEIGTRRTNALNAFNTYIAGHPEHGLSELTIKQTQKRIGTCGYMLTTEDFQWFAMSLNQPIAIVVQDETGRITYRHFTNTGDITAPNDIQNTQAFITLINQQQDTIVIYHSGIHYQALIRDQINQQ